MKRFAVEHDVDAVAYGGEDMFPLTVANADKEFFKRTPHFDPRMTPTCDAIHALAVAHMLDDVARVAQGKLQVVTLHREETAEA